MNLGAINHYWYSVPLAISIALVYAASRHESWSLIWRHAARLCMTIVGLMVATTLLLMFIHSRV